MKYKIWMLFFCLSCSSQNESNKDVSTNLRSEIEEMYTDIKSENILSKNENSIIAMKAYRKHNNKLNNLKEFTLTNENKKEVSIELRSLHQSSINLRDSLVLNSHNMNYSCIKNDFVLPKTDISLTMGDNWDSKMVENLNDSQLDSILDSWEIHNLEWQFVVLELIKDK